MKNRLEKITTNRAGPEYETAGCSMRLDNCKFEIDSC